MTDFHNLPIKKFSEHTLTKLQHVSGATAVVLTAVFIAQALTTVYYASHSLTAQQDLYATLKKNQQLKTEQTQLKHELAYTAATKTTNGQESFVPISKPLSISAFSSNTAMR